MPTSWRQIFYKMRPICDQHPESDRPLIDTTFKRILQEYVDERDPGWDVLYGARGFFKEPHAARNDIGIRLGDIEGGSSTPRSSSTRTNGRRART
jgi:hypothetical protein